MSFILDALKKSEERRQKEQLTAARKRVLVMGGAGPRRWPLWLLVALLPTALLAGWWLGQTPRSESLSAVEQGPRVEHEASSPRQLQTIPDNVVSKTAPAAGVSGQNLPTGQKTLPAAGTLAGQAEPEAPETDHFAPVPLQAPVPVQKPVKQTTSGKTAKTPRPAESASAQPEPAPPPSYLELPRELRERMPLLKITLHFFSADPVRRLVRINGRLLHEGEAVSDGLTIHEITESTTVFDYQGLRFQVPAPSS